MIDNKFLIFSAEVVELDVVREVNLWSGRKFADDSEDPELGLEMC
jgi:hypothetical protein